MTNRKKKGAPPQVNRCFLFTFARENALIQEPMTKTQWFLSAAIVALLWGGCASQDQSSPENAAAADTPQAASEEAAYIQRGEHITPEGAVNVSQMMERLQQAGKVDHIKVTGEVAAVCKKKGCWMVITDGLDSVRVIFKDYGFFVPKDIEGRTVVAEGTAYFDTLTVAQQRHYAQDRGASEEEIAAITDDIITPIFEAAGVLIDDQE